MGEQPLEPGWYDDPEGVADQAYWDGKKWTGATRSEESYRSSVQTATKATWVFALTWVAVIFFGASIQYAGNGYLFGLFAAMAGGIVTVGYWQTVGSLDAQGPSVAQRIAAPVALIATIGLGWYVLNDCDVAESLVAQFAAFVLGPALGITAMAISLRGSKNRNLQRRAYYRILFGVSIIVCVLYWLASFLALTLGSSMCGRTWAWFW